MEMEKRTILIGIKKKAEEYSEKFKGIIRQYPAAVISFFAASLLFAYLEKNDSETVMTAAMFVYRFSLGALFAEELLKSEFAAKRENLQEIKAKIALLSMAALISGLLSFLPKAGVSEEDYSELLPRFRMTFYAVTVIGTGYMMYLRQKTAFKAYVLSVFVNVAQITLLYGLFAAGLAALYAIFHTLLYPVDYIYLAMLETVLAAGIYVPALVIGVSTPGKTGQFIKIVIGYVMTGLISLAFLMVYLYIGKMLIIRELPKNEVFAIVSAIFAVGLPVWTMGQNYAGELPGRAAGVLPFFFAPLILLQGICMGIRVSEYGITVSRYAGLMLIVFECIYLFLYVFKKGKHVGKILPAAVILLAVGLLIPWTNAFAVSTASQGIRLGRLMEKGPENMETAEKFRAYQQYLLIEEYGPEGRNYLKREYSSSASEFMKVLGLTEDDIDNYNYRNSDGNRMTYVYTDSILPADMDISSYSRMERIVCPKEILHADGETAGEEIQAVNLTALPFYRSGDRWTDTDTLKDREPDYVLDLSELMEEFGKEGYKEDHFNNSNEFFLEDGRKIVINELELTVGEDGVITDLAVDAFVFTR